MSSNPSGPSISAAELDETLRYLEAQFGSGHIVALPITVDDATCETLRGRHGIRGLVLREEVFGRLPGAPDLGHFVPAAYQWRLPAVRASSIIFFGPRGDLSFRMVRVALAAGIVHVIYAAPGCWRRELAPLFLLRRVHERMLHEFTQRYGAVIHKLPRPHDTALELWRRFRTPAVVTERVEPVVRAVPKSSLEQLLPRILEQAPVRLPGAQPFVPERILLVNSSLAWGGAERQIVNTLTGLAERGYRDASLLVEHLHDRPDHDFYLWQLQGAGIAVHQIERRLPLMLKLGRQTEWTNILRSRLDGVPDALADEVIYLALEFLERRPGVVHAWQDSTSIKVGLAAAVIGVPRIVLGSRNMAPFRFDYYLPYMAPGYRALAAHPAVSLLNNSTAGAEDYALWLGIPRDRYHVLFNGMRADTLATPGAEETAAYRERLGIPPEAFVIGSIFRFYAEKDPMLWLDTIALVAQAQPDAMFLLVGTGVMEAEVRARATSLGLAARLIMPGTEKRPTLPLSAMDVFLLSSRVEGTPNVVIEAQWLGVPVVATPVGGTPDALEHGRSGWLVESRDAEDLAKRVLSLMADIELRQAFSTRAKEFARARFGLERMIDDTLAAYCLPAQPAAVDSSRLQSPG